MAYARAYPERIKGLLLFAPYLGSGDVLQEVTHAGGICRYAPPQPLPDTRVGFAQANFAWLHEVLCSEPAKLSIWVGIGNRDEARRELLRDVLPPDHYVVLPGGHDWSAWTPALDRITRQAFAAR